MSAQCWGHLLKIPPVGTPLLNGQPLGACWECGVFGCSAHGERDSVSGKWICYPSSRPMSHHQPSPG